MNTTGFDLAPTIADVSQIERNGQLEEMLLQLSLDCRGWPADRAQLFTANELIHEAAVAKALRAMFDLPLDECQAAVRSVLLRQPRRERALDLIDYYLGRHEAEPPAVEDEHPVPVATAIAVTGKLTSMTKPECPTTNSQRLTTGVHHAPTHPNRMWQRR